jgi:hypothetical protein
MARRLPLARMVSAGLVAVVNQNKSKTLLTSLAGCGKVGAHDAA